MSELTLRDDILHACNICNETFDNLVNFTEHSKIHVNMETNNKKPTTIRKGRKKKKKNKYCHICCKTFASAASCSQHMKHFHDTLTASEYDVLFKKIKMKTSTHEHSKETNQKSCNRVCIEDIFLEFEKELPFEFKYDICICALCNTIFENIQDYLNHEKIHYQVIEMQMQVQVPVQVQMTMPMSVPMSVQVQVSMPMSVPMPVQVNMPAVESTSSTDNNYVFYKNRCNICECTFTTNLDFEEHKNTNCERMEQKIPIGDTVRIKTEHNLFYNPSDTVIVEKSTSLNIHSEDHINACKELYMEKQKFYCEICHDTCERSDHFEINQWWNASPNCYRSI